MDRAQRSVETVMQREFVSMGAEDRLDLVEDVMRLGRIRHMPVLDGEKLVGILSQRDLLAASLSRALDFDPAQRRTFLRSVAVAEVMVRDPITVRPDTPLHEAARIMVRHKVGCLPVVDEAGSPVGIVTDTDLLRGVYEVGEGG
jgi:CBS-domain-containing membrane protein